MSESTVHYLQLHPGLSIPELSIGEPFRLVVIAETAVSDDWQYEVGCWLLDSGCLYAMCWGVDCDGWEDAIDWASIFYEERNKTTGDHFLMTSSHADAPLDEVFWFSESCAFDPYIDLYSVLILHISEHDGEDYLRRKYASQLMGRGRPTL